MTRYGTFSLSLVAQRLAHWLGWVNQSSRGGGDRRQRVWDCFRGMRPWAEPLMEGSLVGLVFLLCPVGWSWHVQAVAGSCTYMPFMRGEKALRVASRYLEEEEGLRRQKPGARATLLRPGASFGSRQHGKRTRSISVAGGTASCRRTGCDAQQAQERKSSTRSTRDTSMTRSGLYMTYPGVRDSQTGLPDPPLSCMSTSHARKARTVGPSAVRIVGVQSTALNPTGRAITPQ